VAQFEDTSDVYLLLVTLTLCLELGQLDDRAFVPSSRRPKSLPLFGDSSLSSRRAGNLSPVDRAGYQGPWSVDHVEVLDPVHSLSYVTGCNLDGGSIGRGRRGGKSSFPRFLIPIIRFSDTVLAGLKRS